MALFQYKDLILDGVNNAYQGSKNAAAERNKAFETALQGAGKTVANLKQWQKEQDELSKQNELEEHRQRLLNSTNNKNANMNLQNRINKQKAYEKQLEEYNRQLEEYKQAQSDYENYEPLDYDENMTKEQVAELQGKIGIDADGIWGNESKAALEAYQNKLNELGDRFESMKKPELEDENPNEDIADLQDRINLNNSEILSDDDYRNLAMYLASKFGDNTYLTQYNADRQLEAMNAEKENARLHEAEEAIKGYVNEAKQIIAKYQDEKSTGMPTNETQQNFSNIIAELREHGYDTSLLEASMNNAIGEKVEAGNKLAEEKEKKKKQADERKMQAKKEKEQLRAIVNGLK